MLAFHLEPFIGHDSILGRTVLEPSQSLNPERLQNIVMLQNEAMNKDTHPPGWRCVSGVRASSGLGQFGDAGGALAFHDF